ncbi:unnamed protein product [Rotaria sordida]|uniref:PiggyBac transposable element-derived protein domain-containing protein n=1 Tax=Rotaria sordida TaxID=392033 RepID=A0A815LNA2_9BILA|nr:unnamed protein product [Rotaria sordida]
MGILIIITVMVPTTIVLTKNKNLSIVITTITSTSTTTTITTTTANISSGDEIDFDTNDLLVHQTSSRRWSTGNFSPTLFEFTGEPGVRISTTETSHPLDYFEAFINEEIVNHIVAETNRYQLQNPVGERQNMARWKDTTLPEMYSFLATIILTGILSKNRIRDYWSTDNLISTPIFIQTFTRNRFQDLLRFLHFSNNDLDDADRLVKIKPIIIALKDKFSNSAHPGKNLAIDESLMLWKGRLAFKQGAAKANANNPQSSPPTCCRTFSNPKPFLHQENCP